MSDNFIQSMMARTQARKDTLGRFGGNTNKENKFSQITSETHSHKSEETHENNLPIDSNSTTSGVVPSNNKVLSDDNCSANVEVPTTKSRFKLLAERSKYIKDWEDDYTYHSMSNTKEVPKISHNFVTAKNYTSSMNESTKNSLKGVLSPSKYYFGCNFSNRSSANVDMNSPKKNNSHHKIPIAIVSSPAKHDSHHKRPIATVASPARTESALPCVNYSAKKLSWDTQLLSSLEAQGFTPTSSQSRLVYNFSKDSAGSTTKIEYKCTNVKSPKKLDFQSNMKSPDSEKDIINTPQTKASTSVSNLTTKWETAIRNASPERAVVQSHVSPGFGSPQKYTLGSPQKSSGFGSPQKHGIRSPQKRSVFGSPQKHVLGTPTIIDGNLFEGISRSPEKLPYKSPLRKRPISPYKPNPVGKIVKGDVPMADTVPLVSKEKSSVKDKIAAFSGIASMSQQKPIEHKDPAELSVKDRLNIFERFKDNALIPKAPFAQCIPIESKPQQIANSTPSGHYQAQDKGKEKYENVDYSWKNSEIHEQVQTDRQKDMDVLLNRFKKPFPLDQQMDSDSDYPESEYSGEGSPQLAPAKPPRVATSPPKFDSGSASSSLTNSPVKRLNSTDLYEGNVSSAKPYLPRIKPGCLFPCLSDIESNSEAIESQDEDIKESSLATTTSGESLGTCIQRMAEDKEIEASERLYTIAELTETNKMTTIGDETMDALGEIDNALDEALHNEKSPKRIKMDDSESNDRYVTPHASSVHGSLSPSTPLIHSISMYRKQKPAEIAITPLRHVVLRNQVCTPENSPLSPSINIGSCIRALEREEETQLKVISQASNALSVVHQHPKLQGKDEHIAAEKLLLVSTQKRQSALNEIQRLKAEGALGKSTWALEEESSKGSISVNNITIPLKQEFVNKHMHDKAYHFVVLVKHRDQVITTEVMKTPQAVTESAVTFPNLMSLHNLSAEFNIALEVYCLKIESDCSQSIKKDHSRHKLTPLKRLQKESRVASPMVQSPGGPYAIRSPTFELVGFTNLNINTLTRNAWTLEKVPFNSPLDGHLLMRVSCTMDGGVSEKSFLTMFDDVGGFGAWNRRWCTLTGPFIKYWRYPDDETKKECLNFVDLRSCTTRKVDVVTWDVCARPHTFQLTLIRPIRKGDQTNLVQEVKDSALISKILISADSKEERILWCNKLNLALANIRAWDPDALRPQDFVV